jgi:polyisoprenoid-binding protein YceI
MRLSVLAVVLSLSTVARAQAVDFAVDGAESSITYTIVHKLHKVSGTSKKVEGRARVLPDGKTQVVVRVPSESFDSGNVNRDEHMKEAVEAARYPTIELKAVGEGVAVPASFPSTVKKTFKVALAFHGQQLTFDVPIDVIFESASRAKATAEFGVSLDQYKVERPALMFVKVDDELKIDAKLVFKR